MKAPKDAALPATLKLGLRWDPVALDDPPAPSAVDPGTPGTAGGDGRTGRSAHRDPARDRDRQPRTERWTHGQPERAAATPEPDDDA